jgi:hypothetical protein
MNTDMDTECGRRIEAWIIGTNGKAEEDDDVEAKHSFFVSFLPSSRLLPLPSLLPPPFLLSFQPVLPCTLPLLTAGSSASKVKPPTARRNRHLQSYANTTTECLPGTEAGDGTSVCLEQDEEEGVVEYG